MLTFIVGASIVISLIGRGEIAGQVRPIPSPVERIRRMGDSMEKQVKEEDDAKAYRLEALSSSSTKSEGKESSSEGDDSESMSASSGSGEGSEEKDEGHSGGGSEGESEGKEGKDKK